MAGGSKAMREHLAALGALALFAGAAPAAPITYGFSRTVPGSEVVMLSGSLTTDGTLGAWGSASHVVAFSMDLRGLDLLLGLGLAVLAARSPRPTAPAGRARAR